MSPTVHSKDWHRDPDEAQGPAIGRGRVAWAKARATLWAAQALLVAVRWLRRSWERLDAKRVQREQARRAKVDRRRIARAALTAPFRALYEIVDLAAALVVAAADLFLAMCAGIGLFVVVGTLVSVWVLSDPARMRFVAGTALDFVDAHRNEILAREADVRAAIGLGPADRGAPAQQSAPPAAPPQAQTVAPLAPQPPPPAPPPGAAAPPASPPGGWTTAPVTIRQSR